jgi:hypothetical protein
LSYANGSAENGIGSCLGAIAYNSLMFGKSIVVSGDRPCPDVYLTAHCGIPQITQMGNIGFIAKGSFLQFHKVANPTVLPHHRLLTEMGKGTNATTCLHFTIYHH